MTTTTEKTTTISSKTLEEIEAKLEAAQSALATLSWTVDSAIYREAEEAAESLALTPAQIEKVRDLVLNEWSIGDMRRTRDRFEGEGNKEKSEQYLGWICDKIDEGHDLEKELGLRDENGKEVR